MPRHLKSSVNRMAARLRGRVDQPQTQLAEHEGACDCCECRECQGCRHCRHTDRNARNADRAVVPAARRGPADRRPADRDRADNWSRHDGCDCRCGDCYDCRRVGGRFGGPCCPPRVVMPCDPFYYPPPTLCTAEGYGYCNSGLQRAAQLGVAAAELQYAAQRRTAPNCWSY